jgi:acyloxyacyl hydrolase
MVVFYALVGNDVCNPHPGSHHMTSPAQFKFKVLEALRYLDNGTLSHGSHVVFIGVLDGLMMWDTMAHREHPDLVPVTYGTLWEYLDCLGSVGVGIELFSDPNALIT